MGIFTDNPVLEREVRGRLRLKHNSSARKNLWLIVLLTLIAGYYYLRGLASVWHSAPRDARDFWSLLIYGVLALVVLLAPALAATAITQEREQQTWENLATTQLSAAEVLFGKWIGRQVVPWILIVVLLPFMAVTAARAELNALLLPAALGFLVVTIGFYSALGLLCSSQARRTVTATASALTITLALCAGTVIIDQVLSYLTTNAFSGERRDSFVMWLNPFKVLTSLILQISPEQGNNVSAGSDPNGMIVLIYLAVSLAGTAAALWLMITRYGRAA